MKRYILYISFLAILTIFSGCGSDDGDDSSSNTSSDSQIDTTDDNSSSLTIVDDDIQTSDFTQTCQDGYILSGSSCVQDCSLLAVPEIYPTPYYVLDNKECRLVYPESDSQDVNETNISNNIVNNPVIEKSTKNFDYWGSWKDIESGEELYITTESDIEIESIGENLIKIGENYYLRSGARNVKFQGDIYDDGAGQTLNSLGRVTKGFESIGSIDIILKNILDKNIRAEIRSENDGTFKDESLPTGDYDLKVEDETRVVETVVELVREEEDLGSFQLVPKGTANFKSRLKKSDTIIYGDGTTYSGEVIIKNIGYDVGRGLSFSLSLEGAESFSHEPVLGSIAVDGEKVIPITFSFSPQYNNLKSYYLVVDVVDANNRTWRDRIEIPVHKGSFELQFESQQSITAVISKPNGENIDISGTSKSLQLPLLDPADSYYLIFTNYGNFENEGIYGISLNSDIASFDGFTETSKYEPNENREDATHLNIGDSIVNYLHYEDIDIFKIVTAEDSTKTVEELKNLPPVAKISDVKREQVFDRLITLSGVESSDPENEHLSYSWSSDIDGVLSSSKTFEANLSEGVHQITLTVTDKWNITDSATIEIDVSNSTPTPYLIYSWSGESPLFDFSGSSDDLGIVEYILTSDIDGELYRGTAEEFLADSLTEEKNHQITLQVKDKFGLEANSSIDIEITKRNRPPLSVLEFRGDMFSGAFTEDNEIKLSGEYSSDDREIVEYIFHSSIDGEVYRGTSNYYWLQLSAGDHNITLTVTDSDGVSASASAMLTIEETPNINPTANIGNLNSSYFTTSTISFDGSGSYDSDGNITSISWKSDIDGVLGTGSTTETTLSEGNHTITLTVTDDDGGVGTSTVGVEVTERTVSNKILKTGQIYSIYNGDDGYYQYGAERKYSRDDSTDIVTDLTTGYMWQDGSTIVSKNWQGAIDYCENLTFGGYSDWRLPTLKEMVTIVDYGRNSPAIDLIFENTESSSYWTVTEYNSGSSYSWALYFYDGYGYNGNQSIYGYVRCLR